jgi:hypothetical protein
VPGSSLSFRLPALVVWLSFGLRGPGAAGYARSPWSFCIAQRNAAYRRSTLPSVDPLRHNWSEVAGHQVISRGRAGLVRLDSGVAPTITRTGRLPSGLRFTDTKDGTATISGTPRKAAAGMFPLTLTARNKYGTATQAFTLTVTRAPAIHKIPTIKTRVGAALRRTVRTTGYPAPALTESGPLPSGLTFSDNGNRTAIIAGTPAAGSRGRYPIAITPTNASGTAARHFTIIVSPCRRR